MSLDAVTSAGVPAEPVSQWSCFVWNAHTNKGRATAAYYKGKDLSLVSVNAAICLRTPTKCPKCVLSDALDDPPIDSGWISRCAPLSNLHFSSVINIICLISAPSFISSSLGKTKHHPTKRRVSVELLDFKFALTLFKEFFFIPGN